MPRFSVLIPLYNKDAHIYDTLTSVLNQSFTDYEIILVNDGSTDNSLAEVKKITDERLIIYNRENRGVSQARNFAMQKANGDFFAFLDADDIWKPGHLENLDKLITQHPNCGMYCTNYYFDYGNSYSINPVFPTLPKTPDWSGIVPDFFKASMLYRISWTSAVAIPSDSITTIGFFNECITLGAGEDTEYWSRLALNKPVAFSKKQTAIYNVDAINRISKIDASKRKHMTFEQFYEKEKSNLSLKKFNDMYRIEYAIRQKMSGNTALFEYYKKGLDYNSVSFKNKILLNSPQHLLVSLWHCKQWGKSLKQFLFITFK
jgi:glycosyltransferase involved in cell wall biosynthesis